MKTKKDKTKEAKKNNKVKAKSPKTAKAKKAKVKKTKQLDRLTAGVICLSAFKGTLTIDKAIEKADNIYNGQANGGTHNLVEAKSSLMRALKVMVLCGFLEIKDDQISRLSAPFTVDGG